LTNMACSQVAKRSGAHGNAHRHAAAMDGDWLPQRRGARRQRLVGTWRGGARLAGVSGLGTRKRPHDAATDNRSLRPWPELT